MLRSPARLGAVFLAALVCAIGREGLRREVRAGTDVSGADMSPSVRSGIVALRLMSQPAGVSGCCLPPPSRPTGSRGNMPCGEVDTLTDVRYLRTMINGVPVVAAPAEIDIAVTDQLRAVLLEETGGGRWCCPRVGSARRSAGQRHQAVAGFVSAA